MTSRAESSWETVGTVAVVDMRCPRCDRPVTSAEMQVQSFIPLRDWAAGGTTENNGEVRTVQRPCGHWTLTAEVAVDVQNALDGPAETKELHP